MTGVTAMFWADNLSLLAENRAAVSLRCMHAGRQQCAWPLEDEHHAASQAALLEQPMRFGASLCR